MTAASELAASDAAAIQGEELLGVAQAAERIAADGGQTRAGVAQSGGEGGGEEQGLVDGAAHGGDATRLVDRRADDGEIEAVGAADIAEEDLADMQAQIYLRHRQALGAAALIQRHD